MEHTEHTWDFFIAHAGGHKASAEALYSLIANKARVFLDSKCLKPGDDWGRELTRAQRGSQITVVLVSSTTDKAYYEREEIAAALAMSRENEEGHRVVPVYMDASVARNTNIPYGLRLKHGLSVGDNGDLAPIANQLLSLLQQLRIGVPSREKPESINAPRAGAEQNTSAIRQLLTTALSDEELGQLCMDHFPKVYEQFSTGMSKSQKIQRLLEHSSRHREIQKLLDLVRQANPAAFAAYDG
jgi:hypothetical protein